MAHSQGRLVRFKPLNAEVLVLFLSPKHSRNKTHLVALLLLAYWFPAMTTPKLVAGRVFSKEEKCLTKKLPGAPGETRRKANHPARRRENLFARKFITCVRVSTGCAIRSRPLQSDYRKQEKQESSYLRRRKARHRQRRRIGRTRPGAVGPPPGALAQLVGP